MHEMLEVIQKLILLGALFGFAWQDFQKKRIAVIPIWFLGVWGILLQLVLEKNSVWNMAASMSLGIFLLAISFLTRESIGMGDGFLFLVSGIYLEFTKNMALFYGTIFLLGGFALICSALKKIRKQERIPMAPFMLTAYVLFIL